MGPEAETTALNHWLAAGAPGVDGLPGIVAGLGQRLAAAGIPLDRLEVRTTMLHPSIAARLELWTPKDGVRSFTASYEMFNDPTEHWIGSPLQLCSEQRRIVRYAIGQTPDWDNGLYGQMLVKRLYAHAFITPLVSPYLTKTSQVAYITRDPDGFDAASERALRAIQAPLARLLEGISMYNSTIGVLSTYVGRDAGERVLKGYIRRGDTEMISAVILFADLKGFTELSNREAPEAVIALLNRFFERIETELTARRGEILKFMGDGILAIFPTHQDLSAESTAAHDAIAAVAATRQALARDAEAGDAPLDFRAALHLGEVAYGHIGGAHRLDFTAIGPAVNLTARLLSAAADLGEDLVCSEAFTDVSPDAAERVGTVDLKGFGAPQEVFSIHLSAPGGGPAPEI